MSDVYLRCTPSPKAFPSVPIYEHPQPLRRCLLPFPPESILFQPPERLCPPQAPDTLLSQASDAPLLGGFPSRCRPGSSQASSRTSPNPGEVFATPSSTPRSSASPSPHCSPLPLPPPVSTYSRAYLFGTQPVSHARLQVPRGQEFSLVSLTVCPQDLEQSLRTHVC